MLWQGRPHLPPRRAAIHAATTGSPLASHTHDHKQTARQLSAGLATYAPSSPATTRSLPRSPRSTSPSARRQNTPLIRHDASLARALLRRCPLPHIPSMPHTRPHQGTTRAYTMALRAVSSRAADAAGSLVRSSGRADIPIRALRCRRLCSRTRHATDLSLLSSLHSHLSLLSLAPERPPLRVLRPRAQASWCLSRTSKAPMNSL